jgi:hypothetical protein
MAIREQIFHEVNIAVRLTANEIRESWQEQIYRLAPPYCRDAAVDSIVNRDTGPFSNEISSNHAAVVGIETGFPSRDLKQMLQTSSKTRAFKNGKKYLIIPIRHNTPGHDAHAQDMPKAIHDQAKKMGPSKITGKFLDVNAHGDVEMRQRYQWDKAGDPFKSSKKTLLSIGALPAGLAPKLQTRHKTDPYAGMRRMDTSSGKQKSSAYLTFRIMHEDSTGWIIPAKPSHPIVHDIAQQGQRALEDRISNALRGIGV